MDLTDDARTMAGRDPGAMRLILEYLRFDANHAFWENKGLQFDRCRALKEGVAWLQEGDDLVAERDLVALAAAVAGALERGQPLEHLRSRWKHFADRARDCPAAPASARMVKATTSAEDAAPAFMPN